MAGTEEAAEKRMVAEEAVEGKGGGREGEAGRLGEEGRVRKGSLCFSGRSRMRQNLRRQLGQRGFAGNLLLQLC